MTKDELFAYLQNGLKEFPGSSELLQKLEAKYGSEANLDAGDLLYWLYESIYDTQGWEKHHIDEGQAMKAAREKEELAVENKAVELLQRLAKPVPTPEEQGSI